jgi:CrcB protein
MCFSQRMWRVLLVACGGLAGSVARYGLTGIVQSRLDSAFPLGTLSVNLLGSLLLGLVLALSFERAVIGPDWRLLLAVGFCGGFTTMSTFSFETLALLRDGSLTAALVNAGGTFIGCLFAVWLGDLVGRML